MVAGKTKKPRSKNWTKASTDLAVEAQASVEFIVILVLLFSLLLFSLFVFNEKNSSFIFSKEQFEAKLIANKVARTINTVFLSGDGVQTKVLLEKNFNYDVDFFDNAVQVKWRNNFVDAALLTNKIIFNNPITPGGFVEIKNSNGEIIVGCQTQAGCFSHSWNSAAMTCVTGGPKPQRYCTLAENSPYWTIQNTSTSTTLTITRIKVSWTGDTSEDGDLDVDEITINNIQRNTISTTSGTWNDITDFQLTPGQNITTNNWLKWAGDVDGLSGNMNNDAETYTIDFEFIDASIYTTEGYNPP